MIRPCGLANIGPALFADAKLNNELWRQGLRGDLEMAGNLLDYRNTVNQDGNFLDPVASAERETVAAQVRYLLANREMKQLNLVHRYPEVSRRQCRRSRSPLIIMSATTIAFPFSPVLFILRHPLWSRCELDPGAPGSRRAGAPPDCMIAHRSDVGR